MLFMKYYMLFYYSRTSTEQLKPARSYKEPNDFRTTLLQQLKRIPIYQTNPSQSERSFYSQSPPANQDPNVKQCFLNPMLKQGSPNSSIQVKKPEIIHHFGTKRPLEVQLPPALQTGFRSPPMPGASTASHLALGTQLLQSGLQAPPMPGVSLTSQQVFGNQLLPPGFQAPPMPVVSTFSQQVHFSQPTPQLGFQTPPMPGVSLTYQQALGTQLLQPGFQAPAMPGAFTSSQSSLLFTQPPHQLGFQAPPMPGVSSLVAFSEGKSVTFSFER